MEDTTRRNLVKDRALRPGQAPKVASGVAAVRQPGQPKLRQEVFRVEGIARRGAVRHVKIVGVPGAWSIFGVEGLKGQMPCLTVQEVVQRARRRLGFHPLTIRKVKSDGSFGEVINLPPEPVRTKPVRTKRA